MRYEEIFEKNSKKSFYINDLNDISSNFRIFYLTREHFNTIYDINYKKISIYEYFIFIKNTINYKYKWILNNKLEDFSSNKYLKNDSFPFYKYYLKFDNNYFIEIFNNNKIYIIFKNNFINCNNCGEKTFNDIFISIMIIRKIKNFKPNNIITFYNITFNNIINININESIDIYKYIYIILNSLCEIGYLQKESGIGIKEFKNKNKQLIKIYYNFYFYNKINNIFDININEKFNILKDVRNNYNDLKHSNYLSKRNHLNKLEIIPITINNEVLNFILDYFIRNYDNYNKINKLDLSNCDNTKNNNIEFKISIHKKYIEYEKKLFFNFINNINTKESVYFKYKFDERYRIYSCLRPIGHIDKKYTKIIYGFDIDININNVNIINFYISSFLNKRNCDLSNLLNLNFDKFIEHFYNADDENKWECLWIFLNKKYYPLIGIDCTSRGFQHIGGLFNNDKIIKLVGLIDSDDNIDLYTYIIEKVKKICFDEKNIILIDLINKYNYWNRKLFKHAIIVLIYGAGKDVIFRKIVEKTPYLNILNQKTLIEYFFNIVQKDLKLNIKDIIKNFSDFVLISHNKTITTIDNLTINQKVYKNSIEKVVKIDGNSVKLNIVLSTLNDNEIRNSSFVNYIHSLDSYFIREVIKKANFNILPIHDEFIVHRNNIDKIKEIGMDTYEKIYNNNQILGNILFSSIPSYFNHDEEKLEDGWFSTHRRLIKYWKAGNLLQSIVKQKIILKPNKICITEKFSKI